MTVILMIFTTSSLVFGLSLSSSLQSQSYPPFSIPSTLLGSASVFASSQEPEFPLRYNEEVGDEEGNNDPGQLRIQIHHVWHLDYQIK